MQSFIRFLCIFDFRILPFSKKADKDSTALDKAGCLLYNMI